QEVLAPAVEALDRRRAHLQGRGELRVRERPGAAQPPPHDERLELAPDRLDLGQLGHGSGRVHPAPGPPPGRPAQASMTTGTIIGRRLVVSLTNRPAARRTTRCSDSMSVASLAKDSFTACRTTSAHSVRSGSASGA